MNRISLSTSNGENKCQNSEIRKLMNAEEQS